MKFSFFKKLFGNSEEELPKVGLQKKARIGKGTVQMNWFENESINLPKTLYHHLTFPIEAFDSGIDYVEQPEETELHIDQLNLQLSNPRDLDGCELSQQSHPEIECSIYLGWRHNPCDVLGLKINRTEGNTYQVTGKLKVDFEFEGVAQNEIFTFSATAEFPESE
ncbi:hypothetical protein KFE98_13420 [bacterium SCSIO 12741]|nr:hypothetical protein KFE98_13420 [bacterium SCSIO 12741]